jgi:hypothetical protein
MTSIGLLVHNEIDLSTRNGNVMVFINKTAYQQDVINRDRLSTWLIHILYKPHFLSQDDFESAPPHLTYKTTDADRHYTT